MFVFTHFFPQISLFKIISRRHRHSDASEKVLGWILGQDVSVWSLHVLPVSVWVLLVLQVLQVLLVLLVLQVPPTVQQHANRGVNVSVVGCLSIYSVMNWSHDQIDPAFS